MSRRRGRGRPIGWVRKTSGETQPFSERKLIRSLRNAGAGRAQARRVVDLLRERTGPPLSTRQLYQAAFSLLRQEGRHLAARYSLKRALLELGPTGFPFERILGELLRRSAYQVRFNQRLQGHCVSHEVDVIATASGKRILAECKYHQDPRKKVDLKVALYVQARALDLARPGRRGRSQQFWLVTNTRFTLEAIQYAACAGLTLLSWDHPPGDGLRERISRLGLHPVTCLTRLNKREKQALLAHNIVCGRELLAQPEILRKIGMEARQAERVLEEVEELIRLSPADGKG